ncbi:hypothetical protein [Aequorivita sp. CIP111184]|uniref:hypothetical protein n=1 Tax=Aequorivita sp. CIP111184 TaxID=2211356 RepID=UPI000DBC178B|nr:hypothetical protein [Aequorivita sp. CIP111184]SRX54799.1 hypothetical protein AEQU1_01817 [Aequorivita sp. CIP111184]
MTAKKILKSEAPLRKTPLTKMATTKKIAAKNTTKSVLKTRVTRISIVNSGKVSAVTPQKLETIAQVRHFKFKEDNPVRFDP